MIEHIFIYGSFIGFWMATRSLRDANVCEIHPQEAAPRVDIFFRRAKKPHH
jgi:hypothetical protein